MSRYIRFQTSIRSARCNFPLGVFHACWRLTCMQRIESYALPELDEALAWFNKNLRVPALDGEHHRALFWFRSDAREYIQRIWDIVAVLREADALVEVRRTDEPGKIVYADKHQVAAIRRRRHRDAWNCRRICSTLSA